MTETEYLTREQLQTRLRVSRATVFRWLEGGLPSLGSGRSRRTVFRTTHAPSGSAAARETSNRSPVERCIRRSNMVR